jgi:hypothetical protein
MYSHVYMITHTYISTCSYTLKTYKRKKIMGPCTYAHACVELYMHTSVDTLIHILGHIHIHTYIHTHINAYIQDLGEYQKTKP